MFRSADSVRKGLALEQYAEAATREVVRNCAEEIGSCRTAGEVVEVEANKTTAL